MKLLVLGFAFITSSVYAKDIDTYFATWKISYVDSKGDSVLEGLYDGGTYRVPNSDCKVRPVEWNSKGLFKREVTCGETAHLIWCQAMPDESLTKCDYQVSENMRVYVYVNTQLSTRRQLKKDAEFERTSQIGY